MSLRVAVAAPFRQRGTRRLAENTFVVALSLDRDWFSPDQAKRLIDVASGEGLLRCEDGDLVCEFDPSGVTVPDEFTPDEDLLRRRSPFEQALDALVEAGHEKREVVADVNRLQQELGVGIGAAAVVYARRRGVDVARAADRAEENLRSDGDSPGG